MHFTGLLVVACCLGEPTRTELPCDSMLRLILEFALKSGRGPFVAATGNSMTRTCTLYLLDKI